MTRPRLPSSTSNARSLRRMTEAETLLWQHLRGRNDDSPYHRQVPVGPYVVDFACRRHRVAIECDGGQHAENPYDEHRDARLTARGWRVVRFGNGEIFESIDNVLATIVNFCEDPTLLPDPDD